MDAGTPASLWLLLDSSRSLLLLCQAFFPLTVSTFQSVMTPQLDVISNFFHAFETLLLSSLALCVFQFFPPTFFPKHFCTGTPVFMVQLSQLLKPPLFFLSAASFALYLYPSLQFCCSLCTFLPNHFPSIFIFSLCQIAGLSCFCLLSHFFFLHYLNDLWQVTQMGSAFRWWFVVCWKQAHKGSPIIIYHISVYWYCRSLISQCPRGYFCINR